MKLPAFLETFRRLYLKSKESIILVRFIFIYVFHYHLAFKLSNSSINGSLNFVLEKFIVFFCFFNLFSYCSSGLEKTVYIYMKFIWWILVFLIKHFFSNYFGSMQIGLYKLRNNKSYCLLRPEDFCCWILDQVQVREY